MSLTDLPDTSTDLDDLLAVTERLRRNLEVVLKGKPEVITTTLVVLFAQGHLLLEDVPGVGKTALSKALAHSISGDVHRIQFTPDLMPSDVTGVSVYSPQSQQFTFHPGPVFANVVVADEINRASPKTQSALLECMEERQVTVDDVTYALPAPFMVIATQNPVEMEGTYPLPEAQRDRFTARVSIGYPSPEAEVAMLASHAGPHPLESLSPVTDVAQVARLGTYVSTLHVSDAVRHYAVALAGATRTSPHLRLGISPRAVLQLVRAAQSLAAVRGRDFVLPDDVRDLVLPVMGHRVVPARGVAMGTADVAEILREIVRAVPVPGAERR